MLLTRSDDVLGLFRCGAPVRSWHGGRGNAEQGGARFGDAVEERRGVVRRGLTGPGKAVEAGPGPAGRGSSGSGGRGEVCRDRAWLGEAV
jgi:hypothetical protein